MALTPFQLPSPRIDLPYPEDSILEQMTANPSTNKFAQDQLTYNRLSRQASQDQYTNELAAQHDYANRVLATQQHESLINAIPNYLDKPNGLAIALGVGGVRDILSALPPEQAQAFVNQGFQSAQANIAKAIAAAAKDYIDAGGQLGPDEFKRLTGILTTQVDPLQLQVKKQEGLNQYATDLLKQMMPQGVHMTVTPQGELSNSPMNVPIPPAVFAQGPAAVAKWLSDMGYQQGPVKGPPVSPPTGKPPPTPPSRTGLKPAPGTAGDVRERQKLVELPPEYTQQGGGAQASQMALREYPPGFQENAVDGRAYLGALRMLGNDDKTNKPIADPDFVDNVQRLMTRNGGKAVGNQTQFLGMSPDGSYVVYDARGKRMQ